MLRVAVAARVPRHHAPTTRNEKWGEDVERPGEVEPTVGRSDHRRVRRAPFVGGYAQSARVHPARSVRALRTGVHERALGTVDGRG